MSIYRICAECGECGRVFDMGDETDAAEWAHGHDCEEPSKCIDCGSVAEPGKSYCKPCDAPFFGRAPYVTRTNRTFGESSEKA